MINKNTKKRTLKIAIAELQELERKGKYVKKIVNIDDMMESDDLLNVLLPLGKYQKLINEIRTKCAQSFYGIVNIVTGTGGIIHLNEAILKLAFPEQNTFKTPDVSGHGYNVIDKGMTGKNPQADWSIKKFNDIVNGTVESMSPSSIEALKTDEVVKDNVLNAIPTIPVTPEMPGVDIIRSELKIKYPEDFFFAIFPEVVNQHLLDGIFIQPPEYKPGQNESSYRTLLNQFKETRLSNWMDAIKKVKEEKQKAQKNLDDFEPSSGTIDVKTYRDKKKILQRRFTAWSILEEYLNEPLQIVYSRFEDAKRNQEKGFSGWDGVGVEAFEEYKRYRTIILNNDIMYKHVKQGEKQLKTEIEKERKISNNQETPRLKKLEEELKLYNIMIGGLEAGLKETPTSKDIQLQQIAIRDYCNKVIPKHILTRLNKIIDYNSNNKILVGYIKSLQAQYSLILGSLVSDPSVFSSAAKTILALEEKVSKEIQRGMDFVIFRNIDSNPQWCVKKTGEIQPHTTNEQNYDAGNSGYQGDYDVVPNVIESLKEFSNRQSQFPSGKLKINKNIIFVTTNKVDFPGVDVHYVDFSDFPVDEDEAIALMKFMANKQNIELRFSLIERLKQFLIGRQISSAIKVIRSSFIECYDAVTGEMKKEKLVDVCREISRNTARSISPMLRDFNVTETRKEFVADETTSCGQFFRRKFNEAMWIRDEKEKYCDLLDQIDDEIKQLTNNNEQLKQLEQDQRSKDPAFHKKIEQLKAKKISMESKIKTLQQAANENKMGLVNNANKLSAVLNILFGVSSTGKSFFPRTYSKELEYAYYEVDLNQANNMWHGETEKAMRKLFEALKHLKNAVVNFDEMDGSAFSAKGGGSDPGGAQSVRVSVATMFQSFLEQYQEELLRNNVIIFGSCNNPENLRTAIQKRAKMTRVTSPISENTIIEIINNSLAKLKGIMSRQGVSDDTLNNIQEDKWNMLVNILKSFGDETLKTVGKNFMNANYDFRDVIRELGQMLSNHIYSCKNAECKKAFYEDVTPDKSVFKTKFKIPWQMWDNEGRPNEYEGFIRDIDLRLTKETFIGQSMGKTQTYRTQDTNQEFTYFESGTNLYAAEMGKSQNKQIQENIPVQTELPLNLQKPETEETPEEDLAEEVTTQPKQPIPEKIDTTPEKENVKKTKNPQKISSTDYFYQYLIENQIIKKESQVSPAAPQTKNVSQTQPQKPPQPVQQNKLPTDRMFSVGDWTFIPVDKALIPTNKSNK